MKSPGKSKKEHKPWLQHVRLHHWMMNTAAWQSLNAIEQSFYMQIARRYNGTNNGRIAFGCRDAEKALKVGRRTALRARAILQDRGFIVATRTHVRTSPRTQSSRAQ